MSQLKSAYNLYESKNSFSELIDRVQGGEEIIIMKRGEPVAKLVPIAAKKKKIQFGFCDGALNPGWDQPLKDFEDYE